MIPSVVFDPEFEFASTILGDPVAADEVLGPMIWQIVREPAADRFRIVQMPDVRLAVFVPPRDLPLHHIAIFFRQVDENLIEMKNLCVKICERGLSPLNSPAPPLAA